MKKRKMLSSSMLMGLILLMIFSLGGCKSGTSPQSKENGSEKESILNMAIFWLDPNIEPTDGWNGWTLTRCGIGENLVQIDENLKFKPVIAQDYKQVNDLTYEFVIRDNAKFSNGKLVTAESVKSSIERALKLTKREDVLFKLDKMVANGQKLTIQLTEPDNILINKLTDPVFIIVDTEAAADENFKFKPVCTGAFKIDEFDPEKGMALSKNEFHWSGNVPVDKVNVKYLQDSSTRVMALQSGEIDLATQIEGNDLSLFQDNEKYTVLKGPNLRVFLLRLNMDKPYMKEKAFREALYYGIDKKTYAENIAKGVNANGPFNSALPFGAESESEYTYNPEKAKELLDQAGIVDSNGDGIREYKGENIVMKYYSRTNHGTSANSIGTAMQSQYKEIGIGLEVFQVENYADIAQKGEFDMLWERWTSAPSGDPQYFFEASYKTGSEGNYGHYSNKAFDGICAKLNNTKEMSQRIELGKEGSKILEDDVATLFLYYQEGNVVMNKKVTGVERFISEIYYIDERLKIND